MGAQHTPGPWEVGQDDRHGQAVVRGEYIEICTCWHHSVGAIEKEMRANARLIAAAPDLLAVVKRWAAIDGGLWHFERYAQEKAELEADTRAAIAKATGEAA